MLWLVLLLLYGAPSLLSARDTAANDDNGNNVLPPQTCHGWAGATCEWEPNLHPMTVHYENGYNETFYAYLTPSISTFYNETTNSEGSAASGRTVVAVVEPKFQGFFGKFTNLSPQPIQVHWRSPAAGHALTYLTDIEPFGSAGTATYPHHVFVATPPDKHSKILATWTMTPDNSLYYYDPFRGRPSHAQKALSIQQYHMYHIQYQNQAFAVQYKAFTQGRDWLGLYQHRLPPRFHMWRADAFGQTHIVTTDEIHFVERPPEMEMQRQQQRDGVSVYGPRPDEIQRMRPYRATLPTLQLELKVLSCAPRVFEIRNFLSPVEVDHILQLAAAMELRDSTTRASEAATAVTNESTRTSRNSWIGRNTDMIVDAIHKRAADVLQMPEALLRYRRSTEIPELNSESMISVAERLQLVHYSVGQRTCEHFALLCVVCGCVVWERKTERIIGDCWVSHTTVLFLPTYQHECHPSLSMIFPQNIHRTTTFPCPP
jgi:hypothetical protein